MRYASLLHHGSRIMIPSATEPYIQGKLRQ